MEENIENELNKSVLELAEIIAIPMKNDLRGQYSFNLIFTTLNDFINNTLELITINKEFHSDKEEETLLNFVDYYRFAKNELENFKITGEPFDAGFTARRIAISYKYYAKEYLELVDSMSKEERKDYIECNLTALMVLIIYFQSLSEVFI